MMDEIAEIAGRLSEGQHPRTPPTAAAGDEALVEAMAKVLTSARMEDCYSSDVARALLPLIAAREEAAARRSLEAAAESIQTLAEAQERAVATQAEIDTASAWNAEHEGCCTRELADLLARHRLAVVAETEGRIADWLRGGGDRRGVFYAWDSEMRSYAKGFTDYIEHGDHHQ